MRLVHHVASEICFQTLHPVRSWINRVASEIVFQPLLQIPLLSALLSHCFFFQRNVTVARGTCLFVVLTHLAD